MGEEWYEYETMLPERLLEPLCEHVDFEAVARYGEQTGAHKFLLACLKKRAGLELDSNDHELLRDLVNEIIDKQDIGEPRENMQEMFKKDELVVNAEELLQSCHSATPERIKETLSEIKGLIRPGSVYGQVRNMQHSQFMQLVERIFGAQEGRNEGTEPRWSLRIDEARTLKHSHDGKSGADFALFDSRCNTTSSTAIVTFVDVYRRISDKAETEQFQRAVDFNEHVLASQPCRQHIVSAISTVDTIRFVKSYRAESEKELELTEELRMDAENGAELLIELLLNDEVNGYVGSGIQFTAFESDETWTVELDGYLGQGGTALVFGIRDLDAVCKIFKTGCEKHFEHELRVLTDLAAKIPEDKRHLFGLLIGVNEAERALIISPRGRQDVDPFLDRRLEIVGRQFECLQELRKAGYVHRDIMIRHFLCRPSEPSSVFLIDFGCAQPIGTCHYFQGSPHFSPVELIKLCVRPLKFATYPRHDWISLVNCLSMDLHGDEDCIGAEFEKLCTKSDAEFSGLAAFWTAYYQKFKCCARFVELCRSANRDEDFEAIARDFQEHFKQHKSS